jgi:pentatricopeptide repeat protein
MRKYGINPNELTLQVLFKAFGVSGSIGRALYIYQRMFQQGMIPNQAQLEDIVKSAAIAGDPTTFARFMSRLTHKGHQVKKDHLRSLMLLWKTAGQTNDPYVARMKPNINDFTVAVEYALRVHNYKLAFELVRECRDQYDIQPDAFMYETVLSTLIRDNILRTESYAWRKRLSEYARTIGRREDHFEFASFLSEVEAHIVKELCGGDAAKLSNVAVPRPPPRVAVKRTTRKMSRQLYKSYPRQRWTSPWEAEDDMLDWVPEYKKRRELEPVKKAIELSSATLRAIQEAAHARVASQKSQTQPGSSQ